MITNHQHKHKGAFFDILLKNIFVKHKQIEVFSGLWRISKSRQVSPAAKRTCYLETKSSPQTDAHSSPVHVLIFANCAERLNSLVLNVREEPFSIFFRDCYFFFFSSLSSSLHFIFLPSLFFFLSLLLLFDSLPPRCFYSFFFIYILLTTPPTSLVLGGD